MDTYTVNREWNEPCGRDKRVSALFLAICGNDCVAYSARMYKKIRKQMNDVSTQELTMLTWLRGVNGSRRSERTKRVTKGLLPTWSAVSWEQVSPRGCSRRTSRHMNVS